MKRNWTEEELVERWTLFPDELALVGAKTAHTRLGYHACSQTVGSPDLWVKTVVSRYLTLRGGFRLPVLSPSRGRSSPCRSPVA